MSEKSPTRIHRRSIPRKVQRRTMRPFYRCVDRTHELIGSILPNGDDYQFEYDSRKGKYIVVLDHPKEDPDDYQVGHTAGKIAGALGLMPLAAVFVALDIVGRVSGLLPQHPLVVAGTLIITIACALYAMAALARFISLGVWFQARADHGE